MSNRIRDDLSASSLESRLESAQSGRVLEYYMCQNVQPAVQPNWYTSLDFSEIFGQRSQYFVSWLNGVAESGLGPISPEY